MAFSKVILSGSTDGKAVQVSGTASGSQNTIHTASASATDEVWLWATNTDTSAVALTLALGTTATEGELILDAVEIGVAATPTPVLAGFPITNSVTVTAFAGTTNKINLYGFVNRIS